MVDIKTKRLKEETLEEEIAYYEKDFDKYVFNNWDEFFKSEKKLILDGLHC